MRMDTLPISGLKDLEEHLKAILKDSTTCLDERLIDNVQLQLTEGTTPMAIPLILPLLAKILPNYTSNPKPLTDLSVKLLRSVEFPKIIDIISEDNLLVALQSPFPSAVLLGINIINKASWAPSYTAILSTMKRLIYTLIRIWLSSPDVGVGEAATQALGDLLEMDCDCRNGLSTDLLSKIEELKIVSDMPLGQGLLWRRIFQDQKVYSLLYSLCSLKTIEAEEFLLDRRQKSLAQARLLRLLPRLATLNFQIITHSQIPVVEQTYGVEQMGILSFAAIEMVNKGDLLMHITLIIFFGELLSLMSKISLSQSNIEFLSVLLKRAISNDNSLKDSVESTAADPETSPDLVNLLSKLGV